MNASLHHQAAAQAKTGWLEQALTELLPQVWDLSTESPGWEKSALHWAKQIDLLFEQKKLTTPGQQKNRRTDIANALRTINPNHPVIPFVLLPSEVYTQLNNEQASRLNARENKLFSIKQADKLVHRAIALLDSNKPDEAAAGLAVLVGRRISEILISDFKFKTAYSLLFSEAVKRRGQGGVEFEIPTLAPAERVLEAINHLKQVWTIADLMALDLPDNHLKRRINARYSGVPHACRQHFADLVPGRKAETDNGERLYTHLFRAVYAEIAAYYYKPDWVPDHRFKAEIQGHFKLTTNGQKIPNYSARQNYDDYLIRDRIPGQPGVKLGTPGVQILEVFQTETMAGTPKRLTLHRQLDKQTINALLYRTVERLLFSKQWTEAVTALILVTGRTIQTLMEQELQEKSFSSIAVNGLDVPTLTSARQVVTAWKNWQRLEPLPHALVATAITELCDRTFNDLIQLESEQELRSLYSAIAIHWFCPPTVEPQIFLKTIGAAKTAGFETMNRSRGIKLHPYNIQQQKASQAHEADNMTHEASQDQTLLSALKDQARTLAWLTGRVQDLEQQVEKLQQERDVALSQVPLLEERSTLEQLQQENRRLRQERDEANNTLEQFRQLLGNSSSHSHTQPIHDQPRPVSSSEHLKPSPAPPSDDPLHLIRQAIHAIMAFNDQDGRDFNDMWYISFPAVQTLLRENRLSANQKHVATVFKEMQNEIQHHHDKHAIGSRHNRKHPQLKLIAQLIQLNLSR